MLAFSSGLDARQHTGFDTWSHPKPCSFICVRRCVGMSLQHPVAPTYQLQPLRRSSKIGNGQLIIKEFYLAQYLREEIIIGMSLGGVAPPIICGYNTGQHMYIPARSATLSQIFGRFPTVKGRKSQGKEISWNFQVIGLHLSGLLGNFPQKFLLETCLVLRHCYYEEEAANY